MISLKISVSNTPTPDIVHRFRNFGEDVYTALRERCAVSLEEIDAATLSFYVREVHKRDARTIAKVIRDLLERHNFGSTGTVAPE